MAFKAARNLFRDLVRLPNRLKSHIWQEQENLHTVLKPECGFRPNQPDRVIRPQHNYQHGTQHISLYRYIKRFSKLFWQSCDNGRIFGSAVSKWQQFNRTSILFGSIGLAYLGSTESIQCKLSLNDALMCMQLISKSKVEEQHNDAMGEKTPETLKEFCLKERLGECSSNAAVYAAEYDNREYAIKIMFNYEHASNEYALKKGFSRECCVLAKWNPNLGYGEETLPEHPNIIKVLNVLVEETPCPEDALESYPVALPKRLCNNGFGRNKTLCLVMPKYTCTLRQYLIQFNPTLEDRLMLFAQLLEAVAHLVEHNEAHRDLKADNILLDTATDGCPKLVITDFGCCLGDRRLKLKLPFESDHVDRGGNSVMMAPEVATAVPQAGGFIDYSKADLWACGVLAFEIFGISNPFIDGKLEGRSYREEDIEHLLGHDQVICKLIRLMLRRDPNDRFSAKEAVIAVGLILYAPEKLFKQEGRILEEEIGTYEGVFCSVPLRKMFDLSWNTLSELCER